MRSGGNFDKSSFCGGQKPEWSVCKREQRGKAKTLSISLSICSLSENENQCIYQPLLDKHASYRRCFED